MAVPTTHKNIDFYLSETLTIIASLVESHAKAPLPTKVFKAILATSSIYPPIILTRTQSDALNRIWEIEKEADATLSEELKQVFHSNLRQIVKGAKQSVFPADPAYLKLIKGPTLQCLIRKGHITFRDALSLSPKDAEKIELLGHNVLCKYLNEGKSLQMAFEEHTKIMQAHSIH